jgi:predicted amidohydrolase
MNIRLASVQYSFIDIQNWEEFEKSCKIFIREAVDKKVQLINFPEYFGLQLTSLPGVDSFKSLQHLIPHYVEFFQSLAIKYELLIQAGTIPVLENHHYYNRAYLFDQDGTVFQQDKVHLAPFEKRYPRLFSGEYLKIHPTTIGKIGIAISYDVEFPNLIKQAVKEGANLILVPSCTETLAGYHRVSLCCRARAIENQCFIIQTPTVGKSTFHEWIDENIGRAGIYAPCDGLFPSDGILLEGPFDQEELMVANLPFSQLEHVRSHGAMNNYHDYTLS